MFASTPVDCATYELPLDRTGAVAGTVKVRATRVSAPEGPRLGTLFVIAGGPGQESLEMIGLLSAFDGANRYDIVAIDQRGSGRSEPLSCPRIQSGNFRLDGGDPNTDWPISQCSNSLGAARYAYNTAEAVADLDAVRADLGVSQVTLFGVSYGTKVAMAYAKLHPHNTRALLLDSLVPTEEPGAIDLASIAALRSSLSQICGSRRCRGINSSPIGGLARVARLLARKPLPAYSISAKGKIIKNMIDDDALFSIVQEADFNGYIFNQLPGAITTARRGDFAQIVRLFGIVNGDYEIEMYKRKARSVARKLSRTKRRAVRAPGRRLRGREVEELYTFNDTMHLATSCADLDPPWQRGAAPSERQAGLVAAAAAIPNSGFYPFSRGTVRDRSLAALCRGWQQSPVAPALPSGPLPEVPTLALNGALDMRTPVTWAQRAVSGNSKAELVVLPHTGHSVIGSDPSGCALSLAKRFLIYGETDGKCHRNPPPLPIAPLPPSSLASIKTPRGKCRGMKRRTCRAAKRQLAASYLAIRDTFDQFLLGNLMAGPGLYGGAWEVVFDISDELFDLVPDKISLQGVSNVPGVSVAGSFGLEDFPAIRGRMRVGGFAARGASVNVSGRLALDRAADRLVLSLRRGKQSASIRLRGRGKSARATAFATSRSGLRLRANYARVVGVAAGGSVGR